MATTTDLEKLVINYLTQDQYDDAREAGTLNANELYLTPDTGSTGGTVTSVAVANGGALSVSGSPITTSGTITISHADTSSQSSVSNSGRTYIQSVTLDTYGHVTGLTSATETVTNSDEKLGTDAVTSGTTYYIVAGTNTTGAERKKYDASGIAYKATNGTANGTNGEALLTLGNSTASTSANWKAGKIFLYSSSAYGGTLVPEAVTSSSKTWTLPNKTGTIALISDIPDTSSFITVDENMKWTASTSTNTYYPLQSTLTATTSTANTLNGISFYQYYNTAGGYRRLDLGNATAWKSAGGAYGTIRLYGAAATYYGDLIPGVLGTTSGDGHLTANRTWTFPNASGTVALTSDIPTVPTKTSDLTNDGDGTSNFATMADIGSFGGGTVTSIATTSPISGGTITTTGTISHATSGVGTATTTAGFYKFKYDTYGHVTGVSSVTASDITGLVTIPTNTDESLKTVALTSGTIYYPILATGANAAANRQVDSTISGLKYVSSAGTTSAVGAATLYLGNSTASGTANNEQGVLRVYGTTAYYHDIKGYTGYPAGNRTIYLPRYTSTMYLTCTSTASAVGGATTAPVYVDDTGRIQAVTSIPYTLLSGTPTIPTVPSNIVNTITTTAGTHTTITSQKGDVSFNVPTKTSHLTNDSGFITTDSDENVKSTAIASAMTNYIVGSTTSTTTTGSLSKHASAVMYTTADSGTSGYTQLRLGNTTATSSAGGKEGQIRLYGTNATYYLDLKPGAIASSNKTITFPNKTGTVALTSDIPDMSDYAGLDDLPTITLNGTETTTPNFYAPTSAGTNGHVLKSNGSGAPTWTSAVLTDTKVTQEPALGKNLNLLLSSDGPYTTETATYGVKYARYLLYNDGTVTLSIKNSTNNYITSINATLPTANRTISLPDATGTVALTADLANYLPLTGGDLSGNLRLNADNGVGRWVTIQQNDALVMSSGVSTSGAHGLFSEKGSRWMIQAPADGSSVTINEGTSSNTYIAGDLTVEGHDSPIGTVVTSSDVTIDNVASGGSFKRTDCTIEVTKGVWIVNYYVRFPANATGYRGMRLGYGTSSDITRSDIICQASNSSAVTTRLVGSITQKLTSGRTYVLEILQGSGSSMSGIVGGVVATRLA